MNPFFELMLRAAAIVLVGLSVRLVWWRSSAARRASVLQATLLGVVVLPVAYGLFPRLELPVFEGKTLYVTAEAPDAAANFEEPLAPHPDMRIPWAWGLGTIAVLLYLGAGLVSVLRVRRQSIQTEVPGLRVYLASVPGPMTFGVRRPIVLVPLDFPTWSDAQRSAVLAHESAHIERFDCAWRWLSSLACAVYWCHPLVWWLAGALRADSELAADERAIQSGVPAVDYAEALVAIAQMSNRRSLVSSQGVSFMNPYPLRKRVQHALHHRQNGFTTVGLLTLVASTIAVSGVLATAMPIASQDKVIDVTIEPQHQGSHSKIRAIHGHPTQWKVVAGSGAPSMWKVSAARSGQTKGQPREIWITVDTHSGQNDAFWQEAERMKQMAPIKGESDGEIYEILTSDQAKTLSGPRKIENKRRAKPIRVNFRVVPSQRRSIELRATDAQRTAEHELNTAHLSRVLQYAHQAASEAEKADRAKLLEKTHRVLSQALDAAHAAHKEIDHERIKAEVLKALEASKAAQGLASGDKAKVEIEKAIEELHRTNVTGSVEQARREMEIAAQLKSKIRAADAKTMAQLHKQIETEMAKVHKLHNKIKQELQKKAGNQHSPPHDK